MTDVPRYVGADPFCCTACKHSIPLKTALKAQAGRNLLRPTGLPVFAVFLDYVLDFVNGGASTTLHLYVAYIVCALELYVDSTYVWCRRPWRLLQTHQERWQGAASLARDCRW